VFRYSDVQVSSQQSAVSSQQLVLILCPLSVCVLSIEVFLSFSDRSRDTYKTSSSSSSSLVLFGVFSRRAAVFLVVDDLGSGGRKEALIIIFKKSF